MQFSSMSVSIYNYKEIVMGQQYLMLIPLMASVFSIAYYIQSAKRSNFLNYARTFFYLSASSIVVLFAYFLYLILSHRYDYTYVWSYSANNLSTPLLISTAYAGQEGSFFLWCVYTAVIGIFLLRYSRKHNYEAIVMPILQLVLVFIALELTLKSPFLKVWESFQNVPVGFMPKDGRGLNPLLENFWIVIHPPVLFLGFATAVVPFAYAVAGIVKNDYRGWMRYMQPWLVLNVLTLGAGIIIGGYWAYITLGWGGFWGWDPVENSSLVPWLVSVAALHTILIGRKTGGYLKTSLFLSVTSFILVLYSTFLTRSGVLGDTSVHAFVDPGREVYVLLLVFIGTFLILGYVPLFKYRASIPSVGVGHNLLSRENALFIGAASLSVLSLFVLVGTSSPIITGLLQGKPTAVDSSYYVTTSLPLGFLIIALIGFAQIVWWDKSDKMTFRKNMFLPLAGTIVTSVAALLLSVTQISVILIIAAAAFAFIAHTAAMLRIVRGNPRYIGGPIAHAGIALMFVGMVTSTALESKKIVQLPEGVPVTAYGHEFVYSSNIQVEGKDGFLVNMSDGGTSTSLKPVMYYSDYNQGTMREPDVKSYLAYDLYVSPVSLQNENQIGNGKGVSLVTLVKNKPTKLDDGTLLTLKGFKVIGGEHSTMNMGGTFGVSAILDAVNEGKKIELAPELQFVNGQQKAIPAEAFGNVIAIMDMNVGMGGGVASLRLVVHSQQASQAAAVPVLTVEISRKPLISLLWGGTIVLFVGLIISVYRRFTEESVAKKFSSVVVSVQAEKEERKNAEVHP